MDTVLETFSFTMSTDSIGLEVKWVVVEVFTAIALIIIILKMKGKK